MTTYFEIHSYDGGFKPELIPFGTRRELLPDTAGLTSHEVELGEGEFAVETVVSTHNGKQAIWIGYYLYGIDRQLGPRGNYCGVGVWLIDRFPVSVGRLLKYLGEVSVEIARNRGPDQAIRDTLEKVAVTFDDLHWCIPSDRLPRELSQWRFGEALASSTDYFMIPDDPRMALAAVGANILHRYFRKSQQSAPVARCLYLMKRSSRLPEKDLTEIDVASALASEEDIVWDFCDLLGDPAARFSELERSHRSAEDALYRELGDIRAKLDAQLQDNAALQQQLAASEDARRHIENTFRVVSNALPGIRHLGKASGAVPADSAELATLTQTTSSILDRVDEIRSNIFQLRSSVHLLSNAHHAGSFEIQSVGYSAENKERRRADLSSIGRWVFIFCVGFILVILVIVLFSMFSSSHPNIRSWL